MPLKVYFPLSPYIYVFIFLYSNSWDNVDSFFHSLRFPLVNLKFTIIRQRPETNFKFLCAYIMGIFVEAFPYFVLNLDRTLILFLAQRVNGEFSRMSTHFIHNPVHNVDCLTVDQHYSPNFSVNLWLKLQSRCIY